MKKIFTFLLILVAILYVRTSPVLAASGEWVDVGHIKVDNKSMYVDRNPLDTDSNFKLNNIQESCTSDIDNFNFDDTNARLNIRTKDPGTSKCTTKSEPLPLSKATPEQNNRIYFYWASQSTLKAAFGDETIYQQYQNTNEFYETNEGNCHNKVVIDPSNATAKFTLIVKGPDKCIVAPDGEVRISGDRATAPPASTDENPQGQLTGDEVQQAVDQANCGELGQKCCGAYIDSPGFTPIKPPHIPVLGTAIRILLSPFNALLKQAYKPLQRLLHSDMQTTIYRSACIQPAQAIGDTTELKKLVPSTARGSNPSCTCIEEQAFNIGVLCNGINNDPREKVQCIQCSTHGVWTAIGCVDFQPEKFIGEKLFGLGVGLAGGFSLLCILYSAFLLQSSRGDPERIKKAREYLTNCILGLVLVIFSVLLLRIVGVDILQIPGFGK